MAAPSKRILRALAREIDNKEADITLAESLGRGNTSEVRTWKFQAEQWQEVLDEGTSRRQRESDAE